eukprot:360622-Chlamydomonas_euryale.AAC.23
MLGAERSSSAASSAACLTSSRSAASRATASCAHSHAGVRDWWPCMSRRGSAWRCLRGAWHA